MRVLLQFAAVLALLSLGAGTAVIAWDAHGLALDGRKVLQHADSSLTALDSALGDIGDTTVNIRGVLTETQATAENLKLASAAEADYWNATAKQTSLAARDMRQLIARTDRELNDKFLPDLDAQLTQTSTAAQFSFESLTHASDALAFQLQDPEWGQALHGLNLAANNFSAAAQNGSSILAHGDHVAAYYDKKLTTPLGFWKTFLYSTLDIGAKAGSISAGFVK
jgi:hypothetical protein